MWRFPQVLPATNVPRMPSVASDVLSDADTAGRLASHPRHLRIRGRTSPRSAGTDPPLRAADGTSTGHGATRSGRTCAKMRLVYRAPFVYVAGATEAIAAASDIV